MTRTWEDFRVLKDDLLSTGFLKVPCRCCGTLAPPNYDAVEIPRCWLCDEFCRDYKATTCPAYQSERRRTGIS